MKYLIILTLLFSCSLCKYYPHDNPLEERVEEVLEEKTGWDLDLTPWSVENATTA